MMRKLSLFKYGLSVLMMAFAMTLCYSCSSDDDEEINQEVDPPSNGESPISGTINGHDYVELAGYKWATENVGAVEGVETKAGPGTNGNGWRCYYYTQDKARKAAESWGGTWKLPTEAQWKTLISKCYWKWTQDYNGKSGFIVSDTYEASEFIFLPAAGIYRSGFGMNGVINDVLCQGTDGYCWSADDGKLINFYYNKSRRISSNNSDVGMSVRLVAD